MELLLGPPDFDDAVDGGAHAPRVMVGRRERRVAGAVLIAM
jgi:hypothetical protein